MNTKTAKAIVGAVVVMSLVANAVMAQQAGTGKPQEKFKGPIKVFILAGQSNMEGQGVVSLDGERDYNGGKGNLVWSMTNSKSAENPPPPGRAALYKTQ